VKPIVIDYDDRIPADRRIPGRDRIRDFHCRGDPDFAWDYPADEWDAIALNYTSGTTGNPKGVVFHHRGAALMGYGNVLAANLPRHPVYLWTLRCFTATAGVFLVAVVVAGTHVCLRWVRAKRSMTPSSSMA